MGVGSQASGHRGKLKKHGLHSSSPREVWKVSPRGGEAEPVPSDKDHSAGKREAAGVARPVARLPLLPVLVCPPAPEFPGRAQVSAPVELEAQPEPEHGMPESSFRY